eukprot:CAMPEP_0168363088 /NCGR_PEP_ID=MMETSP0228-20121227/3513_1 /TAXON_ID=133427 /ORGANISM="Protoceratium reticulatum, Strain CCCM 535 (=CCMP 1889)" /LENGTH=318 /DNA_ID=CAMNT_0008375809 /DNA_START=24 /DNA_END=976 /DNA_ORIENTATION=-
MTPSMCLEVLESLHFIIYRPFTPQAAEHKILGEVMDVMEHFEYKDEPGYDYLGFLSHHKADGGEAARVFVDTAHRAVAADEQGGGGTERTELQRRVESARSIDSTRSGRPLLAGRAHAFKDLIFLDSTNLKDMMKIVANVKVAQNLVLLLTRNVLRRPWVLAELITAHRAGNNIVCVLVEWPDREQDSRQFRWPADLEEAIENWKEYILYEGRGGTMPRSMYGWSNPWDAQEDLASSGGVHSPDKASLGSMSARHSPDKALYRSASPLSRTASPMRLVHDHGSEGWHSQGTPLSAAGSSPQSSRQPSAGSGPRRLLTP